ncbi:hypothetical protein E4U38_001272 [Claviceps purpurea]|nr:hypothetical protein E4U38_001272 [Claviceps purpurea]
MGDKSTPDGRSQGEGSEGFEMLRRLAWIKLIRLGPKPVSSSADVTIDEDVLSQLLDDGGVNADLQTEDVDLAVLEDLVTEIENDDLVIPNLGADETELDKLRGILRRGQGELNPSSDIADATGPQGLQMSAIRSTPISDIGVKTRILSLAYPSLHPWGKGDFATSRQRTFDFKPYRERHLGLVPRLITLRDIVSFQHIRIASRDSPSIEIQNIKLDHVTCRVLD